MDEIGSGITSTSLQLDFEGWSDDPRTRVNPARVRLLAQALGYTLVHISKSLQTSRTSVNKWISGLSQSAELGQRPAVECRLCSRQRRPLRRGELHQRVPQAPRTTGRAICASEQRDTSQAQSGDLQTDLRHERRSCRPRDGCTPWGTTRSTGWIRGG